MIIRSGGGKTATEREGKMVTRIWKVYGAEGHRQRESFAPSQAYDWSTEGDARIVCVHNADQTNTNEYSVIAITRNTAEECESELWGQVYDGIFENSRVGRVEECGNGMEVFGK